MFSGRNLPVIQHKVLKQEKDSNPRLFFKVIGDYVKESFAKNFGGHPRSDVALLNEQNDMAAATAVLARMNERAGDGFGADVSDADIAMLHKSKYCQTASEQIKYYENLLKIRDDKELERLEGEERSKRESELQAQREKLRATLTQDEKEYLRKLQRERDIEDLID